MRSVSEKTPAGLMPYRCMMVCICFYFSVLPVHAQTLPEMIRVEGGSFIMGSSNVGTVYAFEDPQHEVTLSSFWIARTETTVRQWRLFCEETRRKMPEAPSWGWIDDHPIINVRWTDAVEYCKWLSKKTGKPYRLPTEAEWEYAARGGKEGKGYTYSGSFVLDLVGQYDKNTGIGTIPVAQKRPNELGLYDMSGNATEWCSDWFGDYTDEPQVNPVGPSKAEYKTVRGGSWFFSAKDARVTARRPRHPLNISNDCGFRVAYTD